MWGFARRKCDIYDNPIIRFFTREVGILCELLSKGYNKCPPSCIIICIYLVHDRLTGFLQTIILLDVTGIQKSSYISFLILTTFLFTIMYTYLCFVAFLAMLYYKFKHKVPFIFRRVTSKIYYRTLPLTIISINK